MSGTDKEPSYEKPKIMIIDIPNSIVDKVKSQGFNAISGTFGSPYKVNLSDNYLPVSLNDSLPNISEQEVIIIDLSKPIVLDKQPPLKVTEFTNWYYARCDGGEIDPRPVVMETIREDLDRIYNNGYVFIIFSAPSFSQSMFYGNGYQKISDLDLTNWCFLTVLGNLIKRADCGMEIAFKDRELSSVFPFLSEIANDSYFDVVFETYSPFKEKKWVPLLWNKYDECIGGLILEDGKGLILILPQFSNKEEIIVKLLKETLPALRPNLFPELVSGKWLEKDDYEFETILQLKSKRTNIEEEAAKKIAEIDEKINQERERLGFLHRILTGTGDQFVKDIECTLKLIFDRVDNIDEQTPEGVNAQEDLQIKDKTEKLLVEIKGLSGFPTESDIAQLNKYIIRRIKEWNSTYVRGLFIVNHQRHIPPLERENDSAFTVEQINDATISRIALFTSWELYLLVKGMQKWKWHRRMIQDLFYQDGRFSGVPPFYKPIGTIVNYFEKRSATAIQISNDKLIKGSTIGYITPKGYYEEYVTSMQIDNKDVDEAIAGQGVGILTKYPKEMIKEGLQVYLVKKSY